MKTFLIGLAIIVAIFLVMGVLFTEMSDRDRLKQVEINHLKKEIKEQADSLKLLKPCK